MNILKSLRYFSPFEQRHFPSWMSHVWKFPQDSRCDTVRRLEDENKDEEEEEKIKFLLLSFFRYFFFGICRLNVSCCCFQRLLSSCAWRIFCLLLFIVILSCLMRMMQAFWLNFKALFSLAWMMESGNSDALCILKYFRRMLHLKTARSIVHSIKCVICGKWERRCDDDTMIMVMRMSCEKFVLWEP